jgi:hypothetical protein
MKNSKKLGKSSLLPSFNAHMEFFYRSGHILAHFCLKSSRIWGFVKAHRPGLDRNAAVGKSWKNFSDLA